MLRKLMGVGICLSVAMASAMVTAQVIERVSVSSAGAEADGESIRPHISADGGRIAFSSSASNLVEADTNGEQDVFVHDRVTGQTSRVSISGTDAEASDVSGWVRESHSGDWGYFIEPLMNINMHWP